MVKSATWMSKDYKCANKFSDVTSLVQQFTVPFQLLSKQWHACNDTKKFILCWKRPFPDWRKLPVLTIHPSVQHLMACTLNIVMYRCLHLILLTVLAVVVRRTCLYFRTHCTRAFSPSLFFLCQLSDFPLFSTCKFFAHVTWVDYITFRFPIL